MYILKDNRSSIIVKIYSHPYFTSMYDISVGLAGGSKYSKYTLYTKSSFVVKNTIIIRIYYSCTYLRALCIWVYDMYFYEKWKI